MTITYDQVLNFINASRGTGLAFPDKVAHLESALRPWDVAMLKEHLKLAGVIPESYYHDSSEEKLYGKYCDIVVLGFFEVNGLSVQLYKKRGGAPNLIGTCEDAYRIIADAKAFRASRTALNPKDYKIDAINMWRIEANADYACLIASRFPGPRSRLYREAVEKGVVLLLFKDLETIISKYGPMDCKRLKPLWEFCASLSNISLIDGDLYWEALRERILNL